jgi:hypothetical protein
MVLTRVITARLAFDVRTFECLNCGNVDRMMTGIERRSIFDSLP